MHTPDKHCANRLSLRQQTRQALAIVALLLVSESALATTYFWCSNRLADKAQLNEDIIDGHLSTLNFNDLPVGVFNTARLTAQLTCQGGKPGDRFIVYRAHGKRALPGRPNHCEVPATGNVGNTPISNENMSVRFYNEHVGAIPCSSPQDGARNVLFTVTSNSLWPQTANIDISRSFTYSKLPSGTALPHGSVHILAPHRSQTQINAYSTSLKGKYMSHWGALAGGDTRLLMSSCSLTQTSQDVQFGNLAPQDLGVLEKPFSIALGNCGNVNSAQAYKNTMRLQFSSPRILANGALGIEQCDGCAANVLIEVLDESGQPIDLRNRYPLARTATLIAPDRLEQRFKARVSASGTGRIKPGSINSQLTFILTSI